MPLLTSTFTTREHLTTVYAESFRITPLSAYYAERFGARMSASQQQTDAELLRLMLAGDEDAFTALYRRRQAGVYRFALQMSGSESLAEDVAQETFMALMRDGRN